MKCLFPALLAASAALAGDLPFREAAVSADGHGWTLWSPRPEIAPRAYLEPQSGGKGLLALSGDSNPAVFGGWQRTVRGLKPGGWYRFRAVWRGNGLSYPAREVVARLDWQDAKGHRSGQPEYPWSVTSSDGRTTVTLDAQAPEKAEAVHIQLLLANAPNATVWWDEVALEPVAAPGRRKVGIASANLYPSRTTDPVGDFLALLDRSLPAGADLAVLPEGITVVGTGYKYADVAEPVPGRTTERLGEFARRKRVWVVAGIYERERQAIYNTAVLIDREGRVAGRYRKVYIPREEFEGGITPGSDYPVFQTDFGTLGMMICWDVQYADPARALALRGAELIAMPIWGGNNTLAKARAIENNVFLVSSGYDHPTYILDPKGEMVAAAPERGTLAYSEIDLNRRYRDEWLGDTRARFWKELRLDTAVDPPGRR